MAENRGVAYIEPGKVEVHDIDFPGFELKDGPGVNPANVGRKTPHGAILRIVSTNICGSDQHMVRGRTTAPAGLILGHEITGEVIETGPDVEFIQVGDLCSVPFNIACGRCRSCKEGNTGVCLNVNPDRPGSAYGYVDMGGWVGGQAEYVMVPYADWNLLKFPDKDQAMEKILDLTMLSDIFPTGFHGAYTAGVGPGSTLRGTSRSTRGMVSIGSSGSSMALSTISAAPRSRRGSESTVGAVSCNGDDSAGCGVGSTGSAAGAGAVSRREGVADGRSGAAAAGVDPELGSPASGLRDMPTR